jgi:diguanylate cyclase (GGDEF)-like protein/PAS domain S-box-containing protein
LGDRRAREELEKARPDLEVARQGLLDGRNHPDDVPDMIWLFRHFRNVTYIDRAIGIWTEADRHIDELRDAAAALHAKVSPDADPVEIQSILARISEVNARLTPLEDAFSYTLGEASRDTEAALLGATLVAAACLALIAIAMSRRMLRQREAVESAERFSEERLHLAMVGSNDGLWEWDLRSGEMYISPRIKDLLGYADREIENTPGNFVALVHPDDRDGALAAVRAHVCKDVPYDVEFRARTKSGGYRWLRARGRSVRDGAGRAVRVAGSVTDVKDRRHAQARLFSDLQDPLLSLDPVGDTVITTDRYGKVTFANAAAERLTGWKFVEARSRPLSDVCQLIEEATHARASDPVERALSRQDEYRVPRGILLRCRDGTEIAVHATAVPVRDQNDEVTGAVLVLRDAQQERHYATQLSYQASHDALTGLINRREFERRLGLALAGARENGRHHAMLYLDLDQFKLVNDTCGHAAGDELMRQVSLVLGERLREGDTLARLGGDEFGVLLENCLPAHAIRIAQGLRQTVTDLHFVWQQHSFTIGVSIGLVNIGGGPTPMTLAGVMSAGDAACYMAKEKGRNRVHVYHPKDTELAVRHGEMEWVARLQGALKANRFCLYAQPIVGIGPVDPTERHFELLLRMIDANDQMVPPMAFIPAAERYNLMPAIDRWVVRQAFELIASRSAKVGSDPSDTYMINLSGASLGDEDFLDFIRERFLQFELATRSICFEITETAAIANFGKAVQFMEELRALGCRFSLDDFGVGMSSFGYLKRLPVDFLKIDGSFVQDMLASPIDSAMVEAINGIGHVMGKRTVAESVEDPSTMERLRELGVDYAQGFAIARPTPFLALSAEAAIAH